MRIARLLYECYYSVIIVWLLCDYYVIIVLLLCCYFVIIVWLLCDYCDITVRLLCEYYANIMWLVCDHCVVIVRLLRYYCGIIVWILCEYCVIIVWVLVNVGMRRQHMYTHDGNVTLGRIKKRLWYGLCVSAENQYGRVEKCAGGKCYGLFFVYK